ncbi:MAG: tRNA (guanosine(37)-N1)-methyltransferase TrmD [Thermicanus sp.]|nr:tRNA (guanosine(37)-N1)-methyltransferase TrmD [Thermicanus sp.]
MRIEILTLFPEMFPCVFKQSILGKAHERGLVEFAYINFRDYSTNKHHTVDDYPFGGGGGMVLQIEPIYLALEHLLGGEDAFSQWLSLPKKERRPRVILTTPQGELFHQRKAKELSEEERLIFICGHYEGYDERIREHLVTDEYSIGDFVLTGGEIAAMAMIDSIVRLKKGVLGNDSSPEEDSFSHGLLEYPQYTRPADFRGWKVPEVLLSGHHGRIEEWRREKSLERTLERRPDLLLSGKMKEEGTHERDGRGGSEGD